MSTENEIDTELADPIVEQGVAAKEAGLPASDCPYGEEGSGDLADRWHAAYAAAKAPKAK